MKKTCPQCGEQMRLVPAGVSKRTGKKYPAFYSCSNRECGHTENLPKTPEQAPQPLPQAPSNNVPQRVWEEKDRRMARMSAIKSACELLQGQVENEEAVLKVAKKFENWIYGRETPAEPEEDVPTF